MHDQAELEMKVDFLRQELGLLRFVFEEVSHLPFDPGGSSALIIPASELKER